MKSLLKEKLLILADIDGQKADTYDLSDFCDFPFLNSLLYVTVVSNLYRLNMNKFVKYLSGSDDKFAFHYKVG